MRSNLSNPLPPQRGFPLQSLTHKNAMEQVKFSEVAHLYLGCEVLENNGLKRRMKLHLLRAENPSDIAEIQVGQASWNMYFREFKPILRPLSDMTEDEGKQIFSELVLDEQSEVFTAGEFLKLLSKGFDLFNLIESGQAIDATKI